MITTAGLTWTVYIATEAQELFDIPRYIADEDPLWIHVRIEKPANTFLPATGDYAYTVENKQIRFTNKLKINAGTKIWIRPNPPITQAANFINGSKLDMEVLENAFDKLTMICQFLEWEIHKRVGIDHVGKSSPFDQISHSAERTDKLLGFSATGALELVPKVVRTPWAESNLLGLTNLAGLTELLGLSDYIRTNLLGLTSLDAVRRFLGATAYAFSTLAKIQNLPALKTHLGISGFASTSLLGLSNLAALKTLLDLKHASTDIHTKTSAYSKAEVDAKIKSEIDALFPGNSYIRQHLASILTRTALEDALFLSPANGFFARSLRTLRTQGEYQTALGIISNADITAQIAAHRDPRFPATSYIAGTLGAETTLAALKTALGIGAATTGGSDNRFSSDSYIAEKLGKLAHLPAVRRTMELYSKSEVDFKIKHANEKSEWEKVTPNTSESFLSGIAVGDRIISGTYSGKIGISDDEGKTWTFSQVFSTNQKVYDLAENDQGVLYAAAQAGGIAYSSDLGSTWTKRNSGITNTLNAIVFHNKVGIAVGASGAGVRSTDGGATWSVITPATSDIVDIVYFKGAFIAVKNYGNILRSMDDGVTWSQLSLPGNSSEHFGRTKIAYNSDRIVIMDQKHNAYVSKNGSDFTKHVTGIHGFYTVRVFHIGEYFYGIYDVRAVSKNFIRSNDGITWEEIDAPGLQKSPGSLSMVHLSSGNEVILGNLSRIFVRRRLQEKAMTREEINNLVPRKMFTIKNKNLSTANIHDLLHINGVFCGVATPRNGRVYLSTGGVDWHEFTVNSFNRISPIMFSAAIDGYGILISNGNMLHSKNGNTWAVKSVNISTVFRAIAYDGVWIVVVGNSGVISYAPNNILIDWAGGIDFSNATVPTGFNTDLLCVIAANRIWLAAGTEGKILRSTDHITWTAVTSGTTDDIHSIVYGASLFVAATNRGGIITSPDGSTWTARVSGTSSYISKGIRKNGKFVFLAQNGIAIVSDDGISWRTANTGVTKTLVDIHYFNGVFYAVGGDASGGVIIQSSDGYHWSPVIESTPKKITCIASSDTQIVFAGDGGNVYYGSGNFPDDSFLGNHLIAPTTERDFQKAIGIGNKLSLSHGNWKFDIEPVNQGGEDTLQLELSRSGEPVMKTQYDANGKHHFTFNGALSVFGGIISAKPFSHIIGPGKWNNISNTGEQHIQYGIWASGTRIVTIGFDGTIYLSTDDGATFTSPTYSASLTVALRGIVSQAPVDGTNLYAVGDSGTLIWSSDSGSTWGDFYATAGVTKLITKTLYSISYQRPSNTTQVWVAVGEDGSIYQFYHASRTGWTSHDRSIATLRAILFGVAASGTTWIAVGANGTIVRSTNNGTTWTIITNSIVDNLRSVTHVSGNQWAAVGESGLIVQSLDGGATWTQIPSGKTYAFYSIVYENGQFIIGGEHGNLLIGQSLEELVEYSIGADDEVRAATIAGNKALVCGASGMIRWNSKTQF